MGSGSQHSPLKHKFDHALPILKPLCGLLAISHCWEAPEIQEAEAWACSTLHRAHTVSCLLAAPTHLLPLIALHSALSIYDPAAGTIPITLLASKPVQFPYIEFPISQLRLVCWGLLWTLVSLESLL